MTDTPRTDADHDAIYAETGVGGLVTVQFARQLERELTEALKFKQCYETLIEYLPRLRDFD